MRGHAAHVNTAVLAVMNIRILLTQIWLSGQNLQRYAVYLSGTFFWNPSISAITITGHRTRCGTQKSKSRVTSVRSVFIASQKENHIP